MKSLRTPLARVRGLGAAKEGVAHWWAQRLTALALIPLALWFAGSVAAMSGASYAHALAWMANPVNAGLLLLLIVFALHHGQLGAQVVIEDYIHGPVAKFTALIAVKGAAILLGLAAGLSVLRIAFGG